MTLFCLNVHQSRAIIFPLDFVGNKGKGRILKRVFLQSTPSFSKNVHFLLPDTHTYVWKVFRKIYHALFSWNTRFEIRSFAILLPTIYMFHNSLCYTEEKITWRYLTLWKHAPDHRKSLSSWNSCKILVKFTS